MSEENLEDQEIRKLELRFIDFKKELEKEGFTASIYITACAYEVVRVLKKYNNKESFLDIMSELYDTTEKVQ